MRRQVDLNSHINATVVRGNPADFEVTVEPIYHESGGFQTPIPNRRAIVRRDNGRAIAVVSDRYSLVPHSRILEVVEKAIEPLDIGQVPKGIYVDSGGARMRALYKFPALAKPVFRTDDICPCLQVRNTYDGTARIGIHIGAFRFVCTNLAVGGGGAFAGGFVSIHKGEIPIEAVAEQLTQYLSRFDRIVDLYRCWSEQRADTEALRQMFIASLHGRPEQLWEDVVQSKPSTVFEAYNVMTNYATHRMRTARRAFELLETVNAGFQRAFAVEALAGNPQQENDIVASV